MQGVRPAGLQKVASTELTEFINLCISPREARPRARQLLKHPYFDSIRKDKALITSRSDAALAAAGGIDGSSEYGSIASGPVSRTASSLNEMVAAVGSAGHPGPLTGPPSASSAVGGALAGPASAAAAVAGMPPLHPQLTRSISAEAMHSDKAHSDSASVRSQRSNASELAALAGVLENIAEEGESAGGRWAGSSMGQQDARAGRGPRAGCLHHSTGLLASPAPQAGHPLSSSVRNIVSSAHPCCRQRRRGSGSRHHHPPCCGQPPGLGAWLSAACDFQSGQAQQPHQQ